MILLLLYLFIQYYLFIILDNVRVGGMFNPPEPDKGFTTLVGLNKQVSFHTSDPLRPDLNRLDTPALFPPSLTVEFQFSNHLPLALESME